ncbi:uncharacterized protein EI97DRAFT_368835 [Westerdykella ornata]|uniref:Zn(2)-C6 fungal-type domain-containing protein n=1 Tax=Westerdykella ornata TaxID=318751 RepID=A0A6A6JU21_WESOR|nr:uncharacterized protein EI97DRAFT_368835 [Westerdykella ornata]KAF2280120.1 hypothetical protein EI97DRAFT_368835 [Westerdykella ornata]
MPFPARKSVSQACDACRRRKIRCNAQQPCAGCQSSGLACTFIIPHGRGGKKGAKATVLHELRTQQSDGRIEQQTSPEITSPSASPHRLTCPSNGSPSCGTLDPAIVDACIEAYLQRVYPVIPFLTREILQREARQASESPLSRQFLAAFCAYVVGFGGVLNNTVLPPYMPDSDLGRQLLDVALRFQTADRVTTQSPQAIFISFFLYGAYAGLGEYRNGWFYLREATTLFMLQMGDSEADWFSPAVFRRLYWILVVSERSHGIRKNRPITLQLTAEAPRLDDPEELGLRYLADIFRPFDEIFFAVWNGSRRDCSKQWLLGVENDVRTALPETLDLSKEQVANLRVTQLWLQVKLWELFPRFGFLSSESVNECLTFRYPITLARDLTILAMKLPIGGLQIHGVGMTEKIFDLACALADVLPFVSFAASQLELGPVDYLVQTTSLLTKLPGGSSKFVPLLLAKVNDLLPELVKPVCEAIQLPVVQMHPLSPDSQFLYEQEVPMNLYTDLRRGK